MRLSVRRGRPAAARPLALGCTFAARLSLTFSTSGSQQCDVQAYDGTLPRVGYHPYALIDSVSVSPGEQFHRQPTQPLLIAAACLCECMRVCETVRVDWPLRH